MFWSHSTTNCHSNKYVFSDLLFSLLPFPLTAPILLLATTNCIRSHFLPNSLFISCMCSYNIIIIECAFKYKCRFKSHWKIRQKMWFSPTLHTKSNGFEIILEENPCVSVFLFRTLNYARSKCNNSAKSFSWP